MPSALILSSGDPSRLVQTLSALVPGITSGVLRGAVVVGPENLAELVDHAGCDFIDFDEGGAAAISKGLESELISRTVDSQDHILIMADDYELSADWQVEALRYLERVADKQIYGQFPDERPDFLSRIWARLGRCAIGPGILLRKKDLDLALKRSGGSNGYLRLPRSVKPHRFRHESLRYDLD
jgi:hypothetical protein